MAMFQLFFLVVLSLYYQARAADVVYGYEDESLNLVQNWDFENDITKSDWVLKGCSGEKIQDGNTNEYSLRISNRKSKRSSPQQTINAAKYGLKKGTHYYFSVFVKILQAPSEDEPYVTVKGIVKAKLNGGGSKMYSAGKLPYQTDIEHWYQLGADIRTPDEDFSSLILSLQVEPLSDYQVDTWSLIELPHDENWKVNLANQAREIRQETQTVTGTFGPEVASKIVPGETTVNIELTRHEFGFGTAIKAERFNDHSLEAYRKFILENFNWVVFENDMKWKPMEGTKGEIKFDRIDQAIAELQTYNMSLRGHALLWDVPSTNPAWLLNMAGSDVTTEIRRRIQYMTEHYKGKVLEWDVCNEFLHEHYYEDATAIMKLLQDELSQAKQVDPSASMCLNDYEIARGSGVLSSATANLARRLQEWNIPVDCIGIQSHLKTLPVAPEALKKRIDIAATPGIPVTITELTLHDDDDDVRAEGVETAFRVYFANPSVHAIVIWGFSDQFAPFDNDMFLTNGPEFTPNAAGNRLLALLAEYRTDETVVVNDASTFSTTVDAFRGNYKLTVRTAGNVDFETDFYIGKEGDHVFKFETP